MSQICITAFKWVPPFAQGLVRDLRVRWALEEAGLPYSEKLLGPGTRTWLRIAPYNLSARCRSTKKTDSRCSSRDRSFCTSAKNRRCCCRRIPRNGAHARTWMFAALNSVEPHVQNLTTIDLFFPNEDWAKQRRPAAEKLVLSRLNAVAASLEGREYLEGRFTAGDLLMVTVLRFLRHTTLVADNPVLAAYQARCESRPAFERALAAQVTHFERNRPVAA